MKNVSTDSKAAEAVKKTAETKAAAVKTSEEKAVKPVETKASEVKAEAKEAEAKTAANAEKAVKAEKAPKTEKAAKAVKEEKTAKAAAKKEEKAAAKKPAKKEADPKTSVYIEYQDKQVLAKDILKLAQKDFKKKHRGETIKTLEIYVKPEENVAYYVVNGEGSSDYYVEL